MRETERSKLRARVNRPGGVSSRGERKRLDSGPQIIWEWVSRITRKRVEPERPQPPIMIGWEEEMNGA